MSVRPLQDKARIEAFLRANPELHLYSLGDLDDFFWPHTTWYGWDDGGKLSDIALVYAGPGLPTVVALSPQPQVISARLQDIVPLLPERFYAHLSPEVENAFRPTHRLEAHGLHYKMALHDASRPAGRDCSGVVRLGPPDLDELNHLYTESYPGNWFDPRMLETGQYFGLRVSRQLVSAAGVHAYSERYRVAAIGNVVTHPAHRNRGYGTRVTARLCQSLRENVEHIGLNVAADNGAALACYTGLGFELIAPYGEFTMGRTTSPSLERT
ncbi:MAG: GNAT family N-acetyltransferase [Planctomycetes bacterium]|jgi:GNAT superfamily N-acetyltransferase|nr:GNAT family N-acetyltransferase [Planctomycetota bacterium]